MNKNIGLFVLAVVVVVLGISYFLKPTTTIQLGQVRDTGPTPLLSAGENFGPRLVVSPATALTLTADQVCKSGIIDFSPLRLDASTTLPSGSSLITTCLSDEGTYKEVMLRNTSSSGLFTLSGGSSSTLLVDAGSVTGTTMTVPGGNYVILRFINVNRGQLDVRVQGREVR